MGGIFDIINVPLGYLFKGIYFLLGSSYGWTLILFTIITKLLLTPLTIKQQRSTMKMQKIQPRLAELQKKYQYDKDKLNQETLKLYQENNISPMGGCLPLLIQFPVLISVYSIIRSPLKYIFQLGHDKLAPIVDAIMGLGIEGLTVTVSDEISLYAAYNQYGSSLDVNTSFMPTIDFNFLGFDLSRSPGFDCFANLEIVALIPIIAGITTFLLSWITQKTSGAQQSSETPGGGTMKMMNYIFPVMTFVFAVTLPAGLGFYWIISNLYQMVQHLVLPKVIKLDDTPPVEKQHYRERENRRKKK